MSARPSYRDRTVSASGDRTSPSPSAPGARFRGPLEAQRCRTDSPPASLQARASPPCRVPLPSRSLLRLCLGCLTRALRDPEQEFRHLAIVAAINGPGRRIEKSRRTRPALGIPTAAAKTVRTPMLRAMSPMIALSDPRHAPEPMWAATTRPSADPRKAPRGRPDRHGRGRDRGPGSER